MPAHHAPSSLALAALAVALPAQGITDYYNVESPQVKSVAIATVNGHDYLLACNTPDNAVEIYDTVGNALVATVPVGLEPVSVAWCDRLSRFFTANFLGDSVTAVDLLPSAGAAPRAVLRRTDLVGDEPMHLAPSADGAMLLVVLGSQSRLAFLDPTTLQPLVPGAERIDLLDDFANPKAAVKEPRVVAFAGSRIVVLNGLGGKQTTPASYDLDLWSADAAGTIWTRGGLGTSNFGMAVAQNGDLWVAGTDAQHTVRGEQNVKAQPSGFVQTFLYQVIGAGTAGSQVLARDLNLSSTGSGTPGAPVGKAQSLAHVTDVALYEQGGAVRKVYLAAFNSDRIGVLAPNGSGQPYTWPVTAYIDIAPVTPIANAMAGPRALAVKYARSGIPGDPGDRVYAMNRLDGSVSVIDPVTDTLVTTFALRRDPTPLHIKNGRRFGYDARLSGNGFSACASCHKDMRSDNLIWDLGDGATQAFPAGLDDGVVNAPSYPIQTFPPNKDFLFTQSLAGLLTAEVNAEAHAWFTTEPLHWRADRPLLESFNGAFSALLGGSPLSATQLDAFRRAVMSIHYPPNPEEQLDRRPAGTLGTPDSMADGTGARRGLKLFHIQPLSVSPGGKLSQGRSCAGCHALPAGTERKVTLFGGNLATPSNKQPMKSTPLRLMRTKEKRLQRDASTTISPVVTGNFGLEHEGPITTINQFMISTFGTDLTAANDLPDHIALMREWDTGTAPLVGKAFTVDATTLPLAPGVVGLLELEARRASSGVAARGSIGGVDRGFWYDMTGASAVYREEPGGVVHTQSQLLALIQAPGDVLVFQGVPLGSERRVAWPASGPVAPLPGPPPSSLTLEPMPADPFWADVPQMTANWDITGPKPFVWGSSTVGTPPTLRALRILQKGILTDGAGLGLGVDKPRHEAPRRLAVAGDDIRHGANLIVIVPYVAASPPPALPDAFTWFWLPIHATDRVNAQGRRIWETTAALEPVAAYTLLLGSYAAPNVAAVVGGTYTTEPPPAGTFQPAVWNQYVIAVLNKDGTLGLAYNQRARLQ